MTGLMKTRGYTYILASKPYGTLYIGVTNDLVRRVYEHRNGIGSEFAGMYHVNRLVWFETYDLVSSAIVREKQLKAWRRAWKIALIEENNPSWDDLYVSIAGT